MTSKAELIKKYLEYSEEELLEISNNAEDYSSEAREALTQVLLERGGLDAVKQSVQKKKEVEVLQNKLRIETRNFLKEGISIDEIKNQASEKLNSIPDMETVITETYEDFIKEKEDKKVKPKTIIGGLIGVFLGGTFGGILWGYQMVQTDKMYILIGAAIVLISYGTIRTFTRKSRKNIAVIIMTIVSVLYAFFLGQIIYEIFGAMA